MSRARPAALGAALATLFACASAQANGSGLAGYTGKPNAAAPQGESCNNCHSGGTAPTVAIDGPSSLAAGAVAEYQLVVTTGLARAGAGVAATDGVVLTPVAGLRDSFGEMVQPSPQVVSGGKFTFRFKVTAPMTGTSIRLWAVGLGANNNGSTSGDKATQTLRDIAITGGAPPPVDAGSSSGSSGSSGATEDDAGAGGSSSGGAGESSGSSGTGSGTAGSSGANDDTPDDPGSSPAPKGSGPARGGADDGGCSTSGGGSSDAAFVGIAIAATIAFARRRRPRL